MKSIGVSAASLCSAAVEVLQTGSMLRGAILSTLVKVLAWEVWSSLFWTGLATRRLPRMLAGGVHKLQ